MLRATNSNFDISRSSSQRVPRNKLSTPWVWKNSAGRLSVCTLPCWLVEGGRACVVDWTSVILLQWKFWRTHRMKCSKCISPKPPTSTLALQLQVITVDIWLFGWFSYYFGFFKCLNVPGILKLPIGMVIPCQTQIQIPMRSWCSQEGDAEASCKPVWDESLYSTWTGTNILTSVWVSASCASLFSSLHAAPSKPCKEWHENNLFSYLDHHSTTV